MRAGLTFTCMSNRTRQSKIFADPQTQELLLGSAKLLELIKKGETFVLNEEDENLTEVFQLEYWKVDWISLTPLGESVVHKERHIYPIRRLRTLGLSSSYYNKSRDVDFSESKLRDRFIKVNGKEIF